MSFCENSRIKKLRFQLSDEGFATFKISVILAPVALSFNARYLEGINY